MKKILAPLLLAVIALPVSAAGAFLLVPLWRWLEARTGIEAIGHSGPATWCFGAVYLLVFLASLGLWWRRRRQSTKLPSS